MRVELALVFTGPQSRQSGAEVDKAVVLTCLPVEMPRRFSEVEGIKSRYVIRDLVPL